MEKVKEKVKIKNKKNMTCSNKKIPSNFTYV